MLIIVSPSLVVPCEQSDTALVPHVRRNPISGNVDSRKQVRSLLVQVDWDLDRLLRCLFLDFVDMLPLEVHRGQSAADLLSKFDTFVFAVVLGSLHAETSQNEPLGVLLDLLWLQVDFKLKLDIFK